MSPSKSSKTKTSGSGRKRVSQSNDPGKASTPKTFPNQRKIPERLRGIPFVHYGVRWADINDDMTQTTILPSAASQSDVPLSSHATTPTRDAVYPALDSVPIQSSVDFVHPKFQTVSALVPQYPDNATRATLYPPITTSFFRNEGGPDFFSKSHTDNSLSMTNNPCQSYNQYVTNHQQTNDLIALPLRSSISLDYDNDPYRHSFSNLNTHHSTPHSTMPYASDTPMTFIPTVYNDTLSYIDTSTGSCEESCLTTMSNDETDFFFGPFPNDAYLYK